MTPAPSYSVRPGRPDEAKVLRAIEWAAAGSFAQLGMPEIAAGEPTDPAVLVEAAQQGRLQVVQDRQGFAVGFALFQCLDGLAHLREMDVDPAHRGRRLGAALLEAGLAWARAAQLPAMTLITFADVPWNAPYYAKLGFAPVDLAGLGPEHQAEWQRQAAAGLPMQRRIVMRRDLD